MSLTIRISLRNLLKSLIPKLNRSEDDIEKVDDNIAETIQILNQTWMAENLNLTDDMLGIDHWKNQDNNEVYYTWYAALRLSKKVEGFHLPTKEDWDKACKDSKFKEKLGLEPYGYYSSGFYCVGSYGYFWLSSEYGSSRALYGYFDKSSSITKYSLRKEQGYSVRLIKNKE